MMSKKKQNSGLLPIRYPAYGLDVYHQNAAFTAGKNAALQKFNDAALPYIMMLTGLERSVAKFDQCVTDRGASMLGMLNKLQQRVYSHFSDIEKVLAELKDDDALESLKGIVYPRLNAYHRLVGDGVDGFDRAEPDAYQDLLALAKASENDKSLVELAMSVNRGGNQKAPGSDYIGQWAIDWLNRHKGIKPTAKNELSNENYRQIAKQMYADLHVRRVEIRDNEEQWAAYNLLGECVKLTHGHYFEITDSAKARDLIRNAFKAKIKIAR